MRIGIVDIGIGNLRSIQNMFVRLGHATEFIQDTSRMKVCDKLILPGMGSFDKCMIALNQSGLREELEYQVQSLKKPFLGICVGLQMLTRSSEEGVEKGLNWIEGETVRFDQSRLAINEKIPNMGWLDIHFANKQPLSDNLQDSRFYFAHSYHVKVDNSENEWINANYGYSFVAGVVSGNIYGVQFHPEKSHKFGMQLLKNFAELT